MILGIWLAFRNPINSRIAQFFKLNHSFSPDQWEKNIKKEKKKEQRVRFQGLFKVTNKIAGIWNAKKAIVWRILQLWFPNFALKKKTSDLIVRFPNGCNIVVIEPSVVQF